LSCDSLTSPKNRAALHVTVDRSGLTLVNQNDHAVFYHVVDRGILPNTDFVPPECGCYPQLEGHASIRIPSLQIFGDTTVHPRTIVVADWRIRTDSTMADAHSQLVDLP